MSSNVGKESIERTKLSTNPCAVELASTVTAVAASHADANGISSANVGSDHGLIRALVNPPPSAKGSGKLLLSEYLQWDDVAIRKGFNHEISPEWRKDTRTLNPEDLTFEEIAAIFNPDICKLYMDDCCWVRYWTKYFALKIQLKMIMDLEFPVWVEELEKAAKVMKAKGSKLSF